jgi:class 3 adenylate cyclase/ligand-binding sensor domain-containing protein
LKYKGVFKLTTAQLHAKYCSLTNFTAEENKAFLKFPFYPYLRLRMQFKLLIKYYSLLLLCLYHISIQAQTGDFSFQIYGFEEGLTHRNVTKIQQDTSGFIWLATVNGLNKFDGYGFVHYTADAKSHSIPQNYIADMHIAPDNRIWLSHPNQISVLEPFNDKYQNTPLSSGAQRGKELTGYNLSSVKGGILTAAFEQSTGNSTLFFINHAGEAQPLTELPGKYNQHPLLLVEDTLYAGAVENELWQFGINQQATGFSFSEKKILQNFSFEGKEASFSRISDMQLTANKSIYILTENGQFYYKTAAQSKFRKHSLTDEIYKKLGIQNFLVDTDENIWLAGRGLLLQLNYDSGELIDLNKKIQATTRYAPNYRQVFQDRSGAIWIASDLGAIKMAQAGRLFTTYLNEGNEFCSSGFCSIRGMCEDDEGNIYFSYYNSIHKLEKTTGVLMPLFPKNNYRQPPFGLAYAQGALWTGNGLRIDLKTLKTDTIFSGRVNDKGVVIVDENSLWFGFENNLTQYFPSKKLKIEYAGKTWSDSTELDITYLHKGQQSGDFWIGTNASGVLQMSRSGQLKKRFQKGEDALSLSDNRILSIYENERGEVWIATANGLDLIQTNTTQIKHFTTEDGLPNNFINTILPEGDSVVWLTTDNGLCRFQLGKNVDNFYKKDGLPANEFNRIAALRASDSRLFFGGMNGVTAFYPNRSFSSQKEESESKLMLTGFSKFDGTTDSLIRFSAGIRADSQLNLSWRDKFFTFNFALADFNNPNENRYSYLLEGYDKDWSESAKVNSARYHNLPAGNYIFRVRGAAGTDEWNMDELILPIRIEEAFYKTKIFLFLSLLLATGLMYAIMQYRLHLTRVREHTLETQVKERTHELEEEKRISDNLLLNILPAETAEELKKTGTAKAKRYEQVTVFFSDFKDFSKIAEQLEPEQLVAEIDFLFRAFDEIITKYGLEKIKTIGDAYMCTVALTEKSDGKKAAIQMVKAALEIQNFIKNHVKKMKTENRPTFEARIGLHTGAVVAGIVGSKKFAYDIWGDTVNIASRMESHGKVGRVNISQTTYELVQDEFDFLHRGKLAVKSKGEVDMYFIKE